MTAPRPLHGRAADDLAFIRDAMARAGAFTAVPGRGMMAIGLTALAAAALAHGARPGLPWLAAWLAEALLAVLIGGVTLVRKSRRAEAALLAGPGRRMLLGFLPAFTAGGLLTARLFLDGDGARLPAVWLLLYGTGVAAAGAFSVRPVPLMGLGFLACGAAALATPAAWGDAWMAAAFGGLHLVCGALIARRHGG